tara:strand:+ start:2462 stop:2851 length:390 start_codon:yes stop_codon:yes gene_type:complete
MKLTNSEDIIRSVVNSSDYKGYVNFIVCQSKHETGNFKSFLAKEKNNLFGMGVPKKRKSNRIGKYEASNGEIFSVYETKADSVNDYLTWLNYTKFPKDLNSIVLFAKELQKRNYATDKNYESKLINICT